MRRVGQVRRRDANEPQIVESLKEIGAQVTRVSGPGAPDLLIAYRGVLYACEVKNPHGRNRTTKAQEATRWPVVRSATEARLLVGWLAERAPTALPAAKKGILEQCPDTINLTKDGPVVQCALTRGHSGLHRPPEGVSLSGVWLPGGDRG